ncbi:MAG TPA: ATP-binding protein, partial [Lysobacter sp.]
MSLHEDAALPADRDLYDGAPCGLLLTRRDGTIVRANRTFCRWVGHPAEALVGRRRFQDLLTMGGRIFHQTHFAPLLGLQGSVSEVKLDLVGADGATVPIVVNAVRDGDDAPELDAIAVFVAKDRHAYERELLRARRRAEELAAAQLQVQQELREADRRKDEFLAMLAHELRNPLAPISTSAQLLPRVADDAARVRRIGEVIGRQIGHLTNLVDDLLDVSRVTRGLIELEREPVDLAEVVAAAVEQARPLVQSRQHRLHVDAPGGLVVDGDRTRLVQIVANLVTNAAKYTPPEGRIDIELARAGAQARLAVRDTGIGIDAALLPHVFDLFSQAERTPDRSQGGLGIGLALVKSLVGLHGGSVEARSAGPGRGSQFEIRLPRIDQAAGTDAAGDGPADQAAPLLVMVVDDNQDAAQMLATLLEVQGHAV